MLVGLPGCGKSTYLKQMGVDGLSSDAIRKLLADDETDQTIHARVFETLRYLLAQRLAIGRPVTYVDATNLTPEERRPYLEMGRVWQCEVEAVFFDVPLAVCQERNSRRNRVVLTRRRCGKWQKQAGTPPTTEEGFVRVTSISGG